MIITIMIITIMIINKNVHVYIHKTLRPPSDCWRRWSVSQVARQPPFGCCAGLNAQLKESEHSGVAPTRYGWMDPTRFSLYNFSVLPSRFASRVSGDGSNLAESYLVSLVSASDAWMILDVLMEIQTFMLILFKQIWIPHKGGGRSFGMCTGATAARGEGGFKMINQWPRAESNSSICISKGQVLPGQVWGLIAGLRKTSQS